MKVRTHHFPSGVLRGGPFSRTPVVLLITILATVALAAPGTADAACGDVAGGRTVACGVLTITADETAVARINLPSQASIDLRAVGLAGKPAGFDVAGAKLFGGFLLLQDTPDRKGVGLLGGRYGDDSLFGRFFPYAAHVFPEAIEGDRLDLPAGPYLLYAITDGAPVEITLHLDGLSGSAALTPAHPAPSRITPLAPRGPAAGANENIYTSGFQQRIDQPGFLMLVNSLEHTAHVAAARGDCGYTQAVDETTAFLPGCPSRATTAGGTFLTGTEVATQAPWWLRSSFFTKPGAAPGTYGLGFWQTTAGVTPKGEALALWLELEAPAE